MNITTFTSIIGAATAGIFLSLCMLHVYWALGRSNVSAAVIPFQDGKPLFTPTPAITLLVALALLICAFPIWYSAAILPVMAGLLIFALRLRFKDSAA